MKALRYSDDIETRREDEDMLVSDILEMMAVSQAQAFDRHRHALRDAHAKSHGVLTGKLVVHSGLPPELSQGLFAEPAEYPVVVRLSSAPGDLLSDRTAAPKGFALKLIGVPGPRILPGDEGGNQDFLLVNIPTLFFGDVVAYKDLLVKAAKHAHDPEFIHKTMTGLARGIASVAEALGAEPGALIRAAAIANTHLLGETFHSMAAIRFGDHVAKLSVAPLSDNVRALAGRTVEDVGPSGMRDIVVDHFRDQGADYVLRAQLCTDLARMPVEDASVLWPEELSPHRPIATVRIPAQDAFSPARRIYGDDVLSFNPWHGIAAHRPLGSIMRVRVRSYEQSTAFRHAMNMRPRVEPTAIGEIPD